MKTVIKTLLITLFIVIVIGFFCCVYILNAPEIAELGPAKLQVHKRTSVRKRPTVNSKPIVYTKNQYLFSIDQKYISNLNIGVHSKEMLFTVALGQRAKLTSEALDNELKTVFNWKEMFADSLGGVELTSNSPKIKVLISGQDWILIDSTGAGYNVSKNNNVLDIYLPNFEEAFNAKKINLSNDLEFAIEKLGQHWLMKDNKYLQSYEIRNENKKLNVYQQSKYPILSLLFQVDKASAVALSEGKFSTELREEFKRKNIPLTKNAKLTANEDGVNWHVSDSTQKYKIQKTDNWVSVYLDLDSKWLFIKVSDALKGWIPNKSGTIFLPPKTTLSSRQKLKERLLNFIDRLTGKNGNTNNPNEPKTVN